MHLRGVPCPEVKCLYCGRKLKMIDSRVTVYLISPRIFNAFSQDWDAIGNFCSGPEMAQYYKTGPKRKPMKKKGKRK